MVIDFELISYHKTKTDLASVIARIISHILLFGPLSDLSEELELVPSNVGIVTFSNVGMFNQLLL